MQLTVLLPGLIWPDPQLTDIYRNLPLPSLEWLLGHGNPLAHPDTLEHWLAHHTGLPAPLPVARLTAALDGVASDAALLRADPVHLQVNMEQLQLVPASALAIDLSDAVALQAALNRHFAADGLCFHTPHPERWYVTLPDAGQVNHTALEQVIGHDIHPLLPHGPDSLRWHSRLNEIQMLFYNHPANESREQRGLPNINSIWFWGDGPLTPCTGWPWHTTCSDNLLLRALTHHAKADIAPLPADAAQWLARPRKGPVLLMLDQLQTAAQYGDAYPWRNTLHQLDQDWFGPIRRACQQRIIHHLTLVVPGQFALDLPPAHRWKFWRRSLPLAKLAASAPLTHSPLTD